MSACGCSGTFKLSEALQKGKAREWLHFCFDLAEAMSNTEKSEPHKSTYVALMPVLST